MVANAPIGMAQYGVRHGHAAGKAQAMRDNPEVELRGVYEPNEAVREEAKSRRAFEGLRWYRTSEEMLSDPAVVAVAIEGLNVESLPTAHESVAAGKHLWYDKPAGDDWPAFQALVVLAREKRVVIQMGFMFRYQDGFQKLAEWARSGALGEVFGIRAHMSTNISEAARRVVADHPGGILYDLAGHMLDQVLWLLKDERPARVTSFLRNDQTPGVPHFADNTLGVFEFGKAMAMVDIAAMEPRPMARRFEVYGTLGSAVLDPMEPATNIRLCLEAATGDYAKGTHSVPLAALSRQRLYELELQALLPVLRGERAPDRPLEHEVLVQETLLRATGRVPGD